MARVTVLPNQKSSTFADNVVVDVTDPRKLTYADVGKTITVQGRDITLGLHQAPPILHTGELHSLRASKGRMVMVLLVTFPGRNFRNPRVIEVLV